MAHRSIYRGVIVNWPEASPPPGQRLFEIERTLLLEVLKENFDLPAEVTFAASAGPVILVAADASIEPGNFIQQIVDRRRVRFREFF